MTQPVSRGYSRLLLQLLRFHLDVTEINPAAARGVPGNLSRHS